MTKFRQIGGPMLLIVLLYALFASSFSLSKAILQYTTPTFLVGVRMVVAGIILLAYQYFSPREKFKVKKKHIWLFLQIILFGIYISYLLRFWGLKYMPSFKAAFIYNLSPFLSSYYSYLFFNERITKKQWLGLMIGFIGLLPVIMSSSASEQVLGEFAFISWPELAIIGAVILHSYSWIVVRKLVKDKSYSPMMVNGISMTCGGMLALGTSFATETITATPLVTHIKPFLILLTAVILISNIICHNLYGFLLKKYSATFLSFAGFLSPLFTALYGWLFLGEIITWHFYVSAAIVFIGLALFYQDEFKQRDQFPPESGFEPDAV